MAASFAVIASRSLARDTLVPIVCIFAVIGIKNIALQLRRFNTVGDAPSWPCSTIKSPSLKLCFSTSIPSLRGKFSLGFQTAEKSVSTLISQISRETARHRDYITTDPSVFHRERTGRCDFATLRGRFTIVCTIRRCYRNRNVAFYGRFIARA